jgi:hypothetical protein
MPSESPRESAYATYTNEEVVGPPTYRVPLPEGVGVRFFPYRGTEMHGVDPGKVAKVADEDVEGGKVDTSYYEPGTPDIDPVPVRIVTGAIHEYQRFHTWQISLNAVSPVMVASRKDGRKNLRIRNFSTIGTNRIWLGSDASVTAYTGYPLSGNDEVIFTGEAEVYGIADAPGPVTVAVLSEYADKEH